jgi:hypothetical protein
LALTVAGLATATPSSGAGDFACIGVHERASHANVRVPTGGACTLIDSNVAGNVTAAEGAYFQATRTTVSGTVHGSAAQTVFVDGGSRVGAVRGRNTIQVFVFDSSVTGGIDVAGTSDVVEICGTTVSRGSILVTRSGRNIRVGDPRAVECEPNVVRRGNLVVRGNFTDVEFVIRGNRVRRGDLEVLGNTGPARKYVEGNVGGVLLRCRGNRRPFRARRNPGWNARRGQCH